MNSWSNIIGKYGKNEKDTGSSSVQIAIITHRINSLTDHLRSNKKDASSRNSLMKMVGKRKRLISYLKRIDLKGYQSLIKDLGIRK